VLLSLRFIETGCSGQPRQVRGPGDEMRRRETVMSVYKIIRLVGTSPTSWEEAAKNAVEEASKHLHDLRISEVEQLDMRLEDGKVVEYRARVHVSFRYKGE
jgi:dodecin